jgi:hypothetical protein
MDRFRKFIVDRIISQTVFESFVNAWILICGSYFLTVVLITLLAPAVAARLQGLFFLLGRCAMICGVILVAWGTLDLLLLIVWQIFGLLRFLARLSRRLSRRLVIRS